MNEEILKILRKYQISDTIFKITYTPDNYFEKIANEISNLYFENEKKNAMLEAKVYAYEKIIASSNFNSILENKKELKGEDKE